MSTPTITTSTLFVVKSASQVALQQMKRGTKIIRDGRYLRIGLVMEKGKYFTSDTNSDKETGVLFEIEESSLESTELTAGILSYAAPRVEVRGRQFFVFGTPAAMEFYEDSKKTLPMTFIVDDEVMVAQIKNVLSGKVQNQWTATRIDLKDNRK